MRRGMVTLRMEGALEARIHILGQHQYSRLDANVFSFLRKYKKLLLKPQKLINIFAWNWGPKIIAYECFFKDATMYGRWGSYTALCQSSEKYMLFCTRNKPCDQVIYLYLNDREANRGCLQHGQKSQSMEAPLEKVKNSQMCGSCSTECLHA